MPARTCAGCGVALPPPGQGRPRSKCEDCSPRRKRDARRRGVAQVTALPTQEAAEAPVGVYAATLAALNECERANSPAGAAALAVAHRLDAGQDSGASVAALAKTLPGLLAEALKGVRAKDGIDEIAERRARRAGA
jgi:hypothetical protein